MRAHALLTNGSLPFPRLCVHAACVRACVPLCVRAWVYATVLVLCMPCGLNGMGCYGGIACHSARVRVAFRVQVCDWATVRVAVQPLSTFLGAADADYSAYLLSPATLAKYSLHAD